MTRDDILVLAKAGFNAQQIAALCAVQTPAPQPVQQPAPAPAPQPEPAPAPAPQPEQPAFDFESLMKKLDGMQTSIQQAAIMQSALPEQPEMTADKILAEIINPPTMNKEG